MSSWWETPMRVCEFVRWVMDEESLSAQGVFDRFEKPWHYGDEYRRFQLAQGVDEQRQVSGVARVPPRPRADTKRCQSCGHRYYYAPHGACPYCRELVDQGG